MEMLPPLLRLLVLLFSCSLHSGRAAVSPPAPSSVPATSSSAVPAPPPSEASTEGLYFQKKDKIIYFNKLQDGWLDNGDKVPPAEFAKVVILKYKMFLSYKMFNSKHNRVDEVKLEALKKKTKL